MTNDNLPTTAEDLFGIFKELGINYTVYEHEPLFKVEDGLEIEKNIPGLHCRNLFVRDKKKKMFLITAANETKVDLKYMQEVLGCGRLSFGSAERLWDNLGVRPGSVCPFAVVNDQDQNVQIVLDDTMMEAEIVCYHPLENDKTVGLSPADLQKFLDYCGHIPHICKLNSE